MRITKCILGPEEHGMRRDIGEGHPIVDAPVESIGTHDGGPWVRVHARGTDGVLHTVRLDLAECDLIAVQAAHTRARIRDAGADTNGDAS